MSKNALAANAPGLSAVDLAAELHAASPRRTFLRQLATLPLIGGTVALIGQPSAVAEPVTVDLVENYKTWLQLELRSLAYSMAADPAHAARYVSPGTDRMATVDAIDGLIWQNCPASRFFRYDRADMPMQRAALVLSTVGVDWKKGAPFHQWGCRHRHPLAGREG